MSGSLRLDTVPSIVLNSHFLNIYRPVIKTINYDVADIMA